MKTTHENHIFFAGVLSTLQMIRTSSKGSPGAENFYHEIASSNDVACLCNAARWLGQLEASGLIEMGYAVSELDARGAAYFYAYPLADRRARETRIALAAKKGDPLARTVLLADLEPLVKAVIRKSFGWFTTMKNRHLEYEDLYQEARFAVLHSLKYYDPNREDASFRGMCETSIWRHLHVVIRESEGIVKVGSKAYWEKKANVLHQTTPSQDEEGNDLIELIADDWAHEGMIEFTERMEFAASVQSLMWFLPPFQNLVIRTFFGLDGGEPMTKAGIAKNFGRSPQDVFEAFQFGMETLRYWMRTGDTPKKAHKPDLKRLYRTR